MREIKFRAWATEGGNMYYDVCWDMQGGIIAKTKFGEELIGGKEDDGTMQYCILMQYTGLKDKNGKEIYEGDIIRETHSSAHIPRWFVGVVEWCDGVGAWSWEHGEDWGMIYSHGVEVIGNIYENPDLLKEKE